MFRSIIIWACVFSFCVSRGENIINNGDFEKNGVGWGFAKWTKSKAAFEFDSTQAYSGKNSLKIVNIGAKDYQTFVSQGIKLKPNTSYRLSFYLKTKDIVPRPKAGLNGAGIYLASGKVLFAGCSAMWKMCTGTNDWKKYEATFKTKANMEKASFYLTLNYSTGTVWFDDIQLSEIKPVAAEILNAKVYPADFQKGSYYLTGRFPGILIFTFGGNAKLLKKPFLELDLPQDFDFLGASCIWPTDTSGSTWKWGSDPVQQSTITRNGQTYIRHKIILNSTMISRLGAWNNYCRVYLQSASGIAGKSGSAFWRLSDNKWKGKEQQFKLNTVKEITYPRRKMKKFRIMITNLRGMLNSMPEVSEDYLNYWPRLAEKPLTYAWHWSWNHYGDSIRKKILDSYEVGILIGGLRDTPLHMFSIWRAQSKAAKKAVIPLSQPLAKRSPKSTICPEYLSNDPEGLIWDDYFPWALRRTRMKYLAKPAFADWDLEPGAMEHCFCDDCRKKFSSMLNLKKTLSATEIKKGYSSQWFDFRLKQHAAIIKKFGESMKKHFPGVAAVLCTDPVHSNGTVARWCGVDCRLSDNGEVDLFRNMPYYQGIQFYKNIEFNNKILKTPNFPIIDPTENMERYYNRYTPQGVLMNMLAAAALCCKGIGFWPDDFFDGRYLHKIAEAAGLIAQGEDYYFASRDDAAITVKALNTYHKTFFDNKIKFDLNFPDFDTKLKKTVHRMNGNYLLTIFNYDKKNDALVKVRLANSGNYHIREINSGLILNDADSRKGFLVEVPKESVKLFEFRKEAFAAAAKLPQAVLEKKLENFKLRIGGIDKFSTVSENNAKISWGVLLPEKIPMMKISGDEFCIYIDPANDANIVGWQNNGISSSDILRHNIRGFLGDIRLLPRSLDNGFKYEYQLDKMYIKDNNPVVELSCKVPQPDNADPNPYRYAGLLIRKIISLEEGGRFLRIKYELKNDNISRKPMKVGCMLRNLPMLGSSLAGSKALSDISTINSGSNRVAAGSPSNNAWFRRGRKNSEFTIKTTGEWSGEAVTVAASDGQRTENLIFIPGPQIIGWYSWWGGAAGFTVELISEEMTIKYAEKRQLELSIKRQ